MGFVQQRQVQADTQREHRHSHHHEMHPELGELWKPGYVGDPDDRIDDQCRRREQCHQYPNDGLVAV